MTSTRIEQLQASLAARGLMAPESFADQLSWLMSAPRVTYRRHGKDEELRRPLIHRFAVRGAKSVSCLIAENITRSNSLLARLQARKHG